MKGDDDDIDTQIKLELDALDEASLASEPSDEQFECNYEENDYFDSSLSQYLSLIKHNERNAEEKVLIAQDVIDALDKVSLDTDQLLEKKLRETLHDDYGDKLINIHAEVAIDLEKIELQDEKNMKLKVDDKTPLALDIIRPDVLEETREIEEAALAKLIELQKSQLEQEKQRQMARKKKCNEDKEFQKLIQEKREAKQNELKKLQERLKLEQQTLTNTLEKDLAVEETRIQNFQNSLQEVIENNLQLEKERLKSLQDEFDRNDHQRKQSGAILVQKHFRRYIAQRLYGPELDIIKRKRLQKEEEKRELQRKDEKRKKIEEECQRIEKIRSKQERLKKEKVVKKFERGKTYTEQKIIVRREIEKACTKDVSNVNVISAREKYCCVDTYIPTSCEAQAKDCIDILNKREEEIGRQDGCKLGEDGSELGEDGSKLGEDGCKLGEGGCKLGEDGCKSNSSNLDMQGEAIDCYDRCNNSLCLNLEVEKTGSSVNESNSLNIISPDMSTCFVNEIIACKESDDTNLPSKHEDETIPEKKYVSLQYCLDTTCNCSNTGDVGNITIKNSEIQNDVIQAHCTEKNKLAEDIYMSRYVVDKNAILEKVNVPPSAQKGCINSVKEKSQVETDDPKVTASKEINNYKIIQENRDAEKHLNITSKNTKESDTCLISFQDSTSKEEISCDIDEIPVLSQIKHIFHNWITFTSGIRTLYGINYADTNFSELKNSQVVKKENAFSITNHAELRCLVLKNSKPPSLSDLHESKHLQFLQLQNCQLTSLSAFFKQLTILNLQNNNLSSVRQFEELSSLVSLNLSDNVISRISGLRNCCKLQYLNVNNNQIVSIKGLQYFKHLNVLSCKNNIISSVDEIQHCLLLREVDFSANSVTKLPAFLNNVLMYKLILDDNNVASIDNIKEYWLPHLTVLSVAGNSIQNLPSLENLILLKVINLKNNLISDANVFYSLKQCCLLERLCIEGNPVISTPNIKLTIFNILIWLKYVDNEKLDINEVTNINSSFVAGCVEETVAYTALKKQLDTVLTEVDAEENIEENFPKQVTLWKELDRLSVSRWNVHRALNKQKEDNEATELIVTEGKTGLAEVSRIEQHPLVVHNKQLKNAQIEKEEKKEKAATKIQTAYRSHRVRQAYLSFLNSLYAKEEDVSHYSEFDYEEEINLDEFELDDHMLEWKVPATPHVPVSDLVSPHIRSGSVTKLQVEEAWNTPVSSKTNLMTSDESSMPTISPESDRSSVGSTRRTEHISEEWGFHNEVTAELMLKRAKKMGVGKKKKVLNSDQRYQLFMKNKDSFIGPVTTHRKQGVGKQSYFQVHGSPTPLFRQYESKQMTYSWVCDQAVLHQERANELFGDEKKNVSEVLTSRSAKESIKRVGSEPIFLPQLDPAVIAGRTVPLVQSEVHNPKPPSKRSSSGSINARRHVLGSESKSHSAPHQRTSDGRNEKELRWKQMAYR